jgi:quinol monooxygenase YgiN
MKVTKGIFLWASVFLFCSFSASAQTSSDSMAEAVHYTNELRIVPDKVEEFYDFIQEAAVDTRAFDGNQYFAILVDTDDPGRVVFYEIWDSIAHHQAYRAWRNETGFGALLGDYLVGGLGSGMQSHYYMKLDD